MERAILVRIDWNENNWEIPTDNFEDVNFRYVIENGISHTAFNFAHNNYEPEPDGLWYGFIPAFFSKTPDISKTRNIKVLFMISVNEGNTYLVGVYAFPKIGSKTRQNLIPNHENINQINIGTEPSNVYRLNNYININTLDINRILGDNQELAIMGWNYLNNNGVSYLLDKIDYSEQQNSFKKIKFSILKSM